MSVNCVYRLFCTGMVWGQSSIRSFLRGGLHRVRTNSYFVHVFTVHVGRAVDVGRRCPSILLRGTIKRFTGLPNVKQGATVQLMLRLLHRSATAMRTFDDTVSALGGRIGCYGIYRGVSSASIYHVYSGPSHSIAAIYIMRGVHSIVTMRGARRCHKLCRILNKIVSPVSNVKPSSLRVRDLMGHIGRNAIGRMVLTLDSAVRKSAAGFCVFHGLTNYSIGVAIVTHKVSVNSRLRCASRIALKHSVIGHITFAKALWE